MRQAQQLVVLGASANLTATQLALAFCLRDVRIRSVLVGARTPAQLDGSLAAVDVVLTTAQLQELERIFPA